MFNLFTAQLYFQLVSSSTRIPQPQESSVGRITIDHFRHIYSEFPCSDKAMVEKVFNIFVEIRAPKIPERLETEEAEVSSVVETIEATIWCIS